MGKEKKYQFFNKNDFLASKEILLIPTGVNAVVPPDKCTVELPIISFGKLLRKFQGDI